MTKGHLINKISIGILAQLGEGKTEGEIPLPEKNQFKIKEYEDSNEKTNVVSVGAEDKEFGIFTNTNFIPLKELTYRELEATLYAMYPNRKKTLK